MSNYKMKTDYEIITEIYIDGHISQKQDVEQYFYNKYLPLIKKYSKRYEHNGFGSYEDNMQECYLIMVNALQNATKKLKEDVSFGSIFQGYIRGYFKVNNSNKSNYNSTNYIEEEFAKTVIPTTCHAEQIISQITYNGFEKELTDYEYTLIELLKAGMKKQTIAKKLGEKNQANLTYHIKRIKNKYIQYMNENGYSIA